MLHLLYSVVIECSVRVGTSPVPWVYRILNKNSDLHQITNHPPNYLAGVEHGHTTATY